MFKTLAGGGQTTAHGVRMLRQVIKIALIISVIALIATFSYRMYTMVPKDRYMDFVRYFKAIGRWDEHAWNHYSDRMDEVWSFAIRQIKPSLKVAAIAFGSVLGIFQVRGLVSKRTRKAKNKSPIKRPLFKNPLHKGFFLGKASLPKKSENTHILVTGGTGSGKTNAFHHILKQVQEKSQKAVILDTTGVFVDRYYSEKRGDIILNPFDAKGRSKHWSPWLDAADEIEYEALAKSFIPNKAKDHDSFWKEAAATVFSSLMEVYADLDDDDDDKLTPLEALTEMLLARPINDLIDTLQWTSAMAHISKEGDKTTASIRSTAASYLNCLKHLQTPDPGREFSITKWVEDESSDSWLFLSCDTKSRDTMRPLLSAWYSTAMRSLMSLDPCDDRRVWFVNDELPSMDQINGLSTCLSEGRKYGACALLATQSPSQIVDIYGSQQAQTITSNCQTKIVFRESEPQNAEQLSKLFGNLELEETKEGLSYGANDMRDGVTQSKQRRKQAMVTVTNIQNLRVNYCYLRDTKGKIKHLKLGIAKKN
ncbi:type IV secretion system DNA-binding domain-containing protein [Candidatus Neptunichlamydia sp. REUL1]|uniref:type IV secretion system DNA-binding domain-containing protein n=1 Tax=Candidatus Neptunichlamydia sp. REUL1 TaxID=3064277 RepID=UPI002931B0D4|nr:type IV secretion system DNA-binding domain-containing protein [Candidatus Neptunochlamydia sp. REUL1]